MVPCSVGLPIPRTENLLNTTMWQARCRSYKHVKTNVSALNEIKRQRDVEAE